MKYWQIIYRTGEEDFETRELLIDDKQYKLIQQALVNGEDMIVILDKPTIKRTSIVSINPADDIVSDYQRRGLKVDGLLEPIRQLKLTGEEKPRGAFTKDTHFSFYKKMKWEHKEDCLCNERGWAVKV